MVDAAVSDQLGFSQHAFLKKSQPLWHPPAADVLDPDTYLDSVELPDAKRIVDQRRCRGRHDPAALRSPSKPVAEVRRAVFPVQPTEADDHRDRVLVDDRCLNPFVGGELTAA